MTKRALAFGSVAQAYERFRPDYPDELASVVLAHAQAPVTTALEIGAGTGKATRLLAAHGVRVTATEPDPEMLAQLIAGVPDRVEPVCSTFENLSVEGPFDLVYAAASLHWTEPDGRWERIAGLLRPGGVFAAFGGPLTLADPALVESVREASSPWLADDDIPSPGHTPPGPLQWPGNELSESPLFADVVQTVIPRRLTMPADQYIGQLATVSAYLMLPGPDRAACLEGIRTVLPDVVPTAADLLVHLARRV